MSQAGAGGSGSGRRQGPGRSQSLLSSRESVSTRSRGKDTRKRRLFDLIHISPADDSVQRETDELLRLAQERRDRALTLARSSSARVLEDATTAPPAPPAPPAGRPSLQRALSSPAIVSETPTPTATPTPDTTTTTDTTPTLLDLHKTIGTVTPSDIAAVDPSHVALFHKVSTDSPLAPHDDLLSVTLENQLSVHVLPCSSPPGRVALRLIVQAGSLHEDDDQLGVAHFLEHLAFRGTKHFADTHIVELLESIGAQFGADANANTGYDRTHYDLFVPSDDKRLLEVGVMALSEFAGLIDISDANVDAERGVVLEEARMSTGPDGQNIAVKLAAARYAGTQLAHRPPIGSVDILKTVTADTIARFYRDHYTLDRMHLLAVGDFPFSTRDFIATVQRFFGALPTRQPGCAFSGPNPYMSPGRTLVPKLPATPVIVQFAGPPDMTFVQLSLSIDFPTRPVRTTAYQVYIDMVATCRMLLFQERLQRLMPENPDAFLSLEVDMKPLLAGSCTMFVECMVSGVPGAVETATKALMTEVHAINSAGFHDDEFQRVKDLGMQLIQDPALLNKNTSQCIQLLNDFAVGEGLYSAEKRELDLCKEFMGDVVLEDMQLATIGHVSRDQVTLMYMAPQSMDGIMPSVEALTAVCDAAYGAPVKTYVKREVESVDFPAIVKTRMGALNTGVPPKMPAVHPLKRIRIGKNDEMSLSTTLSNGMNLRIVHSSNLYQSSEAGMHTSDGIPGAMLTLRLQGQGCHTHDLTLLPVVADHVLNPLMQTVNWAVPDFGFAGLSSGKYMSAKAKHCLLAEVTANDYGREMKLQTTMSNATLMLGLAVMAFTTDPAYQPFESNTYLHILDGILNTKEATEDSKALARSLHSCVDANLIPRLTGVWFNNPEEFSVSLIGTLGTSVQEAAAVMTQLEEAAVVMLGAIPRGIRSSAAALTELALTTCARCGKTCTPGSLTVTRCCQRSGYCSRTCEGAAAKAHAEVCHAVPASRRMEAVYGTKTSYTTTHTTKGDTATVYIRFASTLPDESWRMAAMVCGNMIQTRLTQTLRFQQSATYDLVARVTFPFPTEPRYTTTECQFSCDPEKAVDLAGEALRVLRNLHRKGPSASLIKSVATSFFRDSEAYVSSSDMQNWTSTVQGMSGGGGKSGDGGGGGKSGGASNEKQEYMENVAMLLSRLTPDSCRNIFAVILNCGRVSPRYQLFVNLPESMKEAHSKATTRRKRIIGGLTAVAFAGAIGAVKALSRWL